MGGMAGFPLLREGGAANGKCKHFRLVAAAPGATCAGGRPRTFSSEQVDMAGGLGMVGGRVCDAARSGPAWYCSGSTLQYSTFRRLVQGRAGPDYGAAEVSGQWPVAGNCRGRCSLAAHAIGWLLAQTAASCSRRAGDWLESRRHGGIAEGGVAGAVPPHKGGPERPDRPRAVDSG